jgi:hypothetical protein
MAAFIWAQVDMLELTDLYRHSAVEYSMSNLTRAIVALALVATAAAFVSSAVSEPAAKPVPVQKCRGPITPGASC